MMVKESFLRLPWIGNQSTEVAKWVNSAIKSTYNAAMLHPVFTSQQILPSNQKDVLPSLSSSNVIYKFECAHCENVYVGRTSRRLCDRINEHVPSFIRSKQFERYSFGPHGECRNLKVFREFKSRILALKMKV